MYRLEDATTYFNIDNYYVSFESGLPKGQYKMNKIIGDGGIITGSGALEGRIAKISRAFLKSEEAQRKEFISWFTRPAYDTIYLRRTTTSFDGICQCKPTMSGGEQFASRNFNYGKEVSFDIYMNTPYFESTTLTTTSIAIASTATTSGTITINGHKVFPQYEITSTLAMTQFEVKLAEGYGFHMDYSFTASDTVNVKTSDSSLICTINGNNIYGYFSALSTPFDLRPGSNTLYVKANTGTLLIKYYERQL